jgi:type IV pilus assembly protein PilY1
MKNQRSLTVAAMAMVGWIATATNPAHAGLLNLPNTPLILGLETVPNIFIMMDDSGSMDWEVLTGNHWPTCRYTRAFGSSCSGSEDNNIFFFMDRNGNRRNFYYYSDTDRNAYNDGCPGFPGSFGSNASVRECVRDARINPLDRDWRFMSSDLNLMAYNPQIEYEPWTGFPDASFGGARGDPQPGSRAFDSIVDLGSLGGFEYSVWIDSHGFTGSRPNRDNPNVTTGPNGRVDLFDNHIRVRVTNSGFSCQMITTQPNGSFDVRLNRSTITGPACNNAVGNMSLNALKQNIANWYQYSRKRQFIAKSAVIDVLDTSSGFRYGISLLNRSDSLFIEMPEDEDVDLDDHNEDIRDGLLNYRWEPRGTPLRSGLDLAGRYYRGVAGGRESPITQSCQKNFTLLFTDGFWNGGTPSGIGDSDRDGTSNLLADVANRYYDTDLRPDLEDEVSTDLFDTNNRQHMVTYTIAFGLDTGLVDTDGDGFPNPELAINSSQWWNTSPEPIRRVDDLWHAAFNSSGQFIASQRPEEVGSALRAAVQNIEQRAGSAASGATNGGSLNTNSRLYQARFFSDDWHGELLAFDIESDGGLANSAAWDAGQLLNERPSGYFASERRVFTYDPQDRTGRTFFYNNLNDEQKLVMDTNPDTGRVDNLGPERVLHLRGFDGNEGNPFRRRQHRLGDLVSSDPVFVGGPNFFFDFDNYVGYAEANQNRTPVVYVGANDGMLHAFNADSGQEIFTYVPDAIMSDMPSLTSPNYAHRFYVDGSPSYSDAQIDGAWRSILAGGLRSGGQGIYALDISNPSSFGANNVLWEFTDEDDPDLGYTFSQPTIARMQNGEWAVIFGNGYNNTENDGNASATGEAVLYIAFLDRGLDGWSAGDFVKISTGAGQVNDPNGLGSPGVVDVDGDFIADYIYAGDLRGNLWKFDVTGSTPSSWDVDFGGQPLFEAESPSGGPQPIIERPGAVLHPTGGDNGILVTFGTGKFIENEDRSTENQPTQSVYAIWDLDASPSISSNDHGFSRSQLAQVRFAENSGFRILDDNSEVPEWFNEDGSPNDRGWYLDLPLSGERVIEPVLIRSNTLFFVTLIPNSNPCAAGGSGFLIGLDVRNGSVPVSPLFDINGDNDFDEGDLLGPDNDIVPIGIATGSIPNLPVVIFDRRSFCERNPGHPSCQGGGGGGGGTGGGGSGPQPPFPPPLNSPRVCGGNNDRALLYTTQSNGSIITTTADAGSVQCGRQGWRQLR